MVYHRLRGFYQLSEDDWAEIDQYRIQIRQAVEEIQKSESLDKGSRPHVQYQVWEPEEDVTEDTVSIRDPASGKMSSFPVKRTLTFSETVLRIMQEKGYKRPDVYRRACIDRTLFSKLLANRNYSPSKDTAVAIAFALELDLSEAEILLRRAGYALSHSIARDIVIECCFKESLHEVVKVNIILQQLGYLPLNKIAYR